MSEFTEKIKADLAKIDHFVAYGPNPGPRYKMTPEQLKILSAYYMRLKKIEMHLESDAMISNIIRELREAGKSF